VNPGQDWSGLGPFHGEAVSQEGALRPLAQRWRVPERGQRQEGRGG